MKNLKIISFLSVFFLSSIISSCSKESTEVVKEESLSNTKIDLPNYKDLGARTWNTGNGNTLGNQSSWCIWKINQIIQLPADKILNEIKGYKDLPAVSYTDKEYFRALYNTYMKADGNKNNYSVIYLQKRGINRPNRALFGFLNDPVATQRYNVALNAYNSKLNIVLGSWWSSWGKCTLAIFAGVASGAIAAQEVSQPLVVSVSIAGCLPCGITAEVVTTFFYAAVGGATGAVAGC
jgi:hypothetical protein